MYVCMCVCVVMYTHLVAARTSSRRQRILEHMYICIRVCMYVCMCSYVYIHSGKLAHLVEGSEFWSIGMYVCMCVCVVMYTHLVAARTSSRRQRILEHMYICIRVCMYVCMCSYVYIHSAKLAHLVEGSAFSSIGMYVYVYVCMYVCMCSYVYIHSWKHVKIAYIHTYTQTRHSQQQHHAQKAYIYTYILAHIHTYTHTCTHTCIHTDEAHPATAHAQKAYIYTYIRTYIHTYIQTRCTQQQHTHRRRQLSNGPAPERHKLRSSTLTNNNTRIFNTGSPGIRIFGTRIFNICRDFNYGNRG
jgi:hypothetical protein